MCILQKISGTSLEDNSKPDKAPNALEVALSVIAAALGVQSSKNRERDFTYGKPIVFIFAGFIFTALFVLTIVGVVYLVL